MTSPDMTDPKWETALDASLARALAPPRLPAHFREHLHAALARESDTRRKALMTRYEREHREQLAELESDYLKLRRRTLGSLIGSAFAAGVAVPLVLPWFNEQFGSYAPAALAMLGAAIGLTVGAASWAKARQRSWGGEI